jgi:hypothetical protein
VLTPGGSVSPVCTHEPLRLWRRVPDNFPTPREVLASELRQLRGVQPVFAPERWLSQPKVGVRFVAERHAPDALSGSQRGEHREEVPEPGMPRVPPGSTVQPCQVLFFAVCQPRFHLPRSRWGTIAYEPKRRTQVRLARPGDS